MYDTQFLSKKSAENRFKVIKMIEKGGMGHVGGIYSCIDILVSLYYGNVLKFKVNEIAWICIIEKYYGYDYDRQKYYPVT